MSKKPTVKVRVDYFDLRLLFLRWPQVRTRLSADEAEQQLGLCWLTSSQTSSSRIRSSIFFSNTMEEASKVHILPDNFTRMAHTEREIRIRKKRRRQGSSFLLFVFILSTGPNLASSFICRSRPSDAFNRFEVGTYLAKRSNQASSDRNEGPRRHASSKQNRRNSNTTKKSPESKSRAIDALSQPNADGQKLQSVRNGNSSNNEFQQTVGQDEKSKEMHDAHEVNGKHEHTETDEITDSSLDSLLLPPLSARSKSSIGNAQDPLGNSLSSWEDFLSVGEAGKKGPSTSKKSPRSVSSISKKNQGYKESDETDASSSRGNGQRELPAISDLFPTDMYSKSKGGTDTIGNPFPPTLDGVLPVSDLFYRSSQSLNDDDEITHEDDELPFSAEQSDQLTTVHNKIKIRRNQAKNAAAQSRYSLKRKSSKNRRMVRRGMEMLVGGVPINADPPQRSLELVYNTKDVDWTEKVVTSSRDFGPMLHSASVSKVSEIEKGLFCEHFVHSAMKWKVCPDDLKSIAKEYLSSIANGEYQDDEDEDEAVEATAVESSSKVDATRVTARNDVAGAEATETSTGSFGTLTSFKNTLGADAKHLDANGNPNLGGEIIFSIGVSIEDLRTCIPEDAPVLERVLAKGIVAATEMKGFNVSFEKVDLKDMDDGTTLISGSFVLLLDGAESMTDREMEKIAGNINNSLALAMDEGDVQLAMAAAAKEETGWPEEIRNRVVEEFLFDDDDGDGPLYDFESEKDEDEDEAEDETEEVDEDDVELSSEENESNGSSSLDILNDIRDTYDGPFGMSGTKEYHSDDLFLGGGNDGVFWNYSEQNIAGSPYDGQLGLRLVDAVTQRAKERQPRVIAIGDVHGCIDELQDLLRECDYRPGDLVCFLGDLVSKGPDSISVVQLAREIGAIGVRGNHDFEVVRWHQAIKSGVDPPVVGSEHFHIASCLSNADMKWMYSLPWYISSKELGALFVHAGFVSGIRLGKQNPRLMMNMRSILPDGTVTSKFFNNWPWARLWDGPQTVLFGHDADRGLQQYEHAIGLDTGCVYGGRLTACILPEKRLVSVSAKREYFKYRRKHYD